MKIIIELRMTIKAFLKECNTLKDTYNCPNGTTRPLAYRSGNNRFAMENNFEKYHPNSNYSWKVMSRTNDKSLSYGQYVCEILSRSNLAEKSYVPDTDIATFTFWHWPWRYDFGSRSWRTLGLWTIIVWLSRFDQQMRSYSPDKTWTDWQTDRFIDMHPSFCGNIITN